MILSLLAAGGLLGLAAWFAQGPTPNRVADVPTPDGARQSVPRPVDTNWKERKAIVQKGLDYLARQQFEDGHWEDDGGNHPVAMTGMAGLALLVERAGVIDLDKQIEGMAPEVKHTANIRKATDWLMAQSRAGRHGLIFSDHPSETSRYMQGHGLATLFLAGVCANETDEARRKKLTEVLARAVAYIADAQSTQGGWYDTSRVEGHDFATVQATAIQVQALQAAQNAGIPISLESLGAGAGYLQSLRERVIGPTDAAAAALACLEQRGLWWGVKTPDGFEEIRTKIPNAGDVQFGRDELTHYYSAQAKHNIGNDDWIAYLGTMTDRLRDVQNKDGSWPAGDGIGTGRVYSTAIWCIVLQLGNESHPCNRMVEVFD
jgi:hypothetical protein